MFVQLVQAFSRMSEGRLSLQSLTLKPGQVIVGEVVKQLSDREVVVRIANQMMRAVTEVPLAVQERHWFQVQPHTDSLVLKVVTDMKQAKQAAQPTSSALLQSWGVEVTKQHVQTVEWLMKRDFPLTRQTVEQLTAVWQKLGQTPDVEQAVLLTLSKRLPLNMPIVEAIHRFVSGSPMPQLLRALAAQLQKWAQAEGSLPPQVKAQIEAVVRQIDSLSNHQQIKPGTPSTEPAASQTAPARGQGPPAPVPVQAATAKNESVPNQNGFIHSPTVPQGENAATRGSSPESLRPETPIKLNDSALATFTSRADGKSPVTATFIQKWLQVLGIDREANLARLIRSTVGTASDVSPETVDASVANVKESLVRLLQFNVPAHIRDMAETTVQQITGQQLLLSTSHETNWQHLLLHIPFQLPGHREASVHVFTRQKNGGKLDEDNCRLLLQLELEQLGWNCLLVQIVKRAVHIEWYSDDGRLPELLQVHEPHLRKQLQAVGYHFSGVTVKPLSQQTEKVDQSMWPLAVADGKGVDIRI